MGPRKCQLLIIPCVAFSLTLFALGGADPTGEFCLRTLSFTGPSAIVGPILDTFTISHDVVSTLREELERHVNISLLLPFTAPVRAHRFASLVLTPWGYKAGGRPCANLRPLVRTPIASPPPSLRLKRKRGRKNRSRNRGKAHRVLSVLLLGYHQN
jgi:hypothetical protein